ncbi:MAG: HNH endonuclease [Acutalibacteraceae bacterium]
MPRKPKQHCAYPGCPRLSYGRYCDEHKRITERNYEKYSRNPEVHRKYGQAWKRIRDSYVKEHPFCEKCFERGILVPVDEVHHIIPVSKGGTHDKNNLMSLCKSCHNKIHYELGDRNVRN